MSKVLRNRAFVASMQPDHELKKTVDKPSQMFVDGVSSLSLSLAAAAASASSLFMRLINFNNFSDET